MEVFHNCTEAMLTKQDVESTDAEKKMSDSEKKKHESDKNNAYSSLRELNKVCVDCGQQDPDWLSINLGIFICIGACPLAQELPSLLAQPCLFLLLCRVLRSAPQHGRAHFQSAVHHAGLAGHRSPRRESCLPGAFSACASRSLPACS
jgi:hypothetical protein